MRTFGFLLHPIYRKFYNTRRAKFLNSAKKFEGIKVLSVGNISLGGAGKTPLTLTLFSKLLLSGKRGGLVLKRGERNNFIDEFLLYLNSLIQLSDDSSFNLDCDNTYIYVRNDKGFIIYTKNKLSGLRIAEEASLYDFALVDDGFQLFSLKPDLGICIVTSQDFSEKTFPLGFLREEVTQLKRADIALFRDEIASNLAKEFISDSKCYSLEIYPMGLLPLSELINLWITRAEESIKIREAEASVPAGTAIIFSGIANPASFEQTALSLHPDISCAIRFPDHHSYHLKDIDFLLNLGKSKGCKFFITTEKDACRMLPYLLAGKSAEGLKVKFPEELMPRVTFSTPELTVKLNELAQICFYVKVQSKVPKELFELISSIFQA